MRKLDRARDPTQAQDQIQLGTVSLARVDSYPLMIVVYPSSEPVNGRFGSGSRAGQAPVLRVAIAVDTA